MITKIIETGNFRFADFCSSGTSQVNKIFASCIFLFVICPVRPLFRRCPCLQKISGCDYEIFCVFPVPVEWWQEDLDSSYKSVIKKCMICTNCFFGKSVHR